MGFCEQEKPTSGTVCYRRLLRLHRHVLAGGGNLFTRRFPDFRNKGCSLFVFVAYWHGIELAMVIMFADQLNNFTGCHFQH